MNTSTNQCAANNPAITKWNFFKADYDEEKNTTTVRYNLEITEYYGGRRSNAELCDDITESIRLAMSTISKQIGGMSFDMLMEHSDNVHYVQETANFFHQLSKYLEGYTNLLEIANNYRESISERGADTLKLQPDFTPPANVASISSVPHFWANRRGQRLAADRRAVAEWLSNAVKSGSDEVKSLAGDLITALETGDHLNSADYIERVLLDLEIEQGEKADDIADRLSTLASDSKATDKEISEKMSIVIDALMNDDEDDE